MWKPGLITTKFFPDSTSIRNQICHNLLFDHFVHLHEHKCNKMIFNTLISYNILSILTIFCSVPKDKEKCGWLVTSGQCDLSSWDSPLRRQKRTSPRNSTYLLYLSPNLAKILFWKIANPLTSQFRKKQTLIPDLTRQTKEWATRRERTSPFFKN